MLEAASCFADAGTKQGHRRHVEPDWASDPSRAEAQARHAADPVGGVHRAQSRRATATRASASCIAPGKASCRRRCGRRHVAGDKLFVDYAGDTVPVIIDRLTGEDAQGADLRRRARRVELHLCRGDLDAGARRLDRRAHPRLRRRSAACRRLLVPDNPKVAVIKACLYEPEVNRTYAEMAAHYDTAIVAGAAETSRATRRLLHTAPHSGDCAVMETSRAGGRRDHHDP